MTTLAAAEIAVGTPCTTCAWPVVAERGAAPWCPKCGWNIECYEPERRRQEMRWEWADKLSFATAYDLNARQFADLSGRPVHKPGIGWVRAVLLLIAVVLLGCVVGLAVFGVWLIVAIHSLLAYVLGAIAIFIAITLRPRFGKLGKYDEPVDPADLPHLSKLIADVAASIGAPRPQTLMFTTEYNAKTGAYGLRRRRILTIGLPLWLSLAPQERVALLGHELGHFVNGDVREGPLTRFAFQVMAKLVMLTTPDKGRSRYTRSAHQMSNGGMAVIGDMITRWVFAVFCLIFSVCSLLIEWLSMRASHHAEYAADTLAVRVGGSAAATSMLDALTLRDACITVLRRSVRADPSPDVWRQSVAIGRQEISVKRSNLRQLSMRDEASLFRSHPPTGLRAQLIESRPQESAAVVLTEADAAEIDHELATRYAALRRDLGNSDWA